MLKKLRSMLLFIIKRNCKFAKNKIFVFATILFNFCYPI